MPGSAACGCTASHRRAALPSWKYGAVAATSRSPGVRNLFAGSPAWPGSGTPGAVIECTSETWSASSLKAGPAWQAEHPARPTNSRSPRRAAAGNASDVAGSMAPAALARRSRQSSKGARGVARVST